MSIAVGHISSPRASSCKMLFACLPSPFSRTASTEWRSVSFKVCNFFLLLPKRAEAMSVQLAIPEHTGSQRAQVIRCDAQHELSSDKPLQTERRTVPVDVVLCLLQLLLLSCLLFSRLAYTSTTTTITMKSRSSCSFCILPLLKWSLPSASLAGRAIALARTSGEQPSSLGALSLSLSLLLYQLPLI